MAEVRRGCELTQASASAPVETPRSAASAASASIAAKVRLPPRWL
jgi:hypothetical protein